VLIASFNFGVPIVLPGLAALAFILGCRAARPRFVMSLFLLPVLTGGAIVAKNGIEHDLWALSSGVGQNVIQAYNSGLDDPTDHERGAYMLGKRNGYPDWWLWCYDEAAARGLHPNPNVPGWYGMCMYRPENGRLVFDYGALQRYFADHPDPRMEAVVAKDMAIVARRPWLFSGPVAIRITGVSIEYGKISKRILVDTLVDKPGYFIRHVYRVLVEHWLGYGARFLVDRNRARVDEPVALYLMNWLGVPTFYIGVPLALFCFFRTGWRVARTIRRPALDAILGEISPASLVITVCIVPAMFASILFACCENYRHSFVFVPLFAVLTLDAVRRRSFWRALGDFGLRTGRGLRILRS
jgi:hypothetical protein